VSRFLAGALLLAASPAWAQHTEVSVLAGYTTSGDIEMKAPQFQDLAIDGSFTWGLQVGHFFSERLGAELSWSRQQSALAATTAAGSAELFDVRVDQVVVSVAYQLGGDGGGLRPFLSAGLGAAFFGADEPDDETKLALVLGAGVKWFPSGRIGARLQARYSPKHLNDAESDFCDAFGFCQSWLQQFELLGGVSLGF
jgi:outer membrane protein W